jgi:hypothetical protein
MLLYKYPSLNTSDDRLEFPLLEIPSSELAQFSNYYGSIAESPKNTSPQVQLEFARNRIIIPPCSSNTFPWKPTAIKEAVDIHAKYLYETYENPPPEMKRRQLGLSNYIVKPS